MGKFSKRAFNDVTKRPGPLAYTHNGSQRIDKRPGGRVERFVDPVGGVMNIKLGDPGSVTMDADVTKTRREHHLGGFVEHAKCPLRHGTRHASPAISKDFTTLPADLQSPCEHDPKTLVKNKFGGIETRPACPHVEWLIVFRREQERLINEARNTTRADQEAKQRERDELQTIQLEMAREELAAKRAANAEREAKKKTAKNGDAQ